MRILIALAVLLLSGCAAAQQKANNEALQKIAMTWIGDSEAYVIQRQGVPDKAYEVDGVKYLSYVRTETGSQAGMVLPRVGPSTMPTLTAGVSSGRYCVYTFVIRKGVVSDVRWEGNVCHAA